jgi:hypothetical protein
MTTMEPTPEQFAEWLAQAMEGRPIAEELKTKPGFAGEVARLAYAAGADAELEECCGWLSGCGCPSYGRELRAARRPKPPCLKQQALKDLEDLFRVGRGLADDTPTTEKMHRLYGNLRQAVMALPED